MEPNDAAAHARRRRVIHSASLYTYGFLAAGLVTAVGGAAVVAWLLTHSGLPFLETWTVLVLIILVPSGIGLVWQAVRERTRRGQPRGGGHGQGRD